MISQFKVEYCQDELLFRCLNAETEGKLTEESIGEGRNRLDKSWSTLATLPTD